MSTKEWEYLCDGCGKCCLIRLDDDEAIGCTNVSCILLDTQTCRCINYQERHSIVPECLDFNAEQVSKIDWLPKTCAYRLVENGQPLPAWHHLMSGKRESVHEAGVSVRGKVVPEDQVDDADLADHIVEWGD